jgi:hypothetical protein
MHGGGAVHRIVLPRIFTDLAGEMKPHFFAPQKLLQDTKVYVQDKTFNDAYPAP